MVNSDIRHLKFISFSLNNISGYSEQLINVKTDEQMIELIKKITE